MFWVSCRDEDFWEGPSFRDVFAVPSSKIDGLSNN